MEKENLKLGVAKDIKIKNGKITGKMYFNKNGKDFLKNAKKIGVELCYSIGYKICQVKK